MYDNYRQLVYFLAIKLQNYSPQYRRSGNGADSATSKIYVRKICYDAISERKNVSHVGFAANAQRGKNFCWPLPVALGTFESQCLEAPVRLTS